MATYGRIDCDTCLERGEMMDRKIRIGYACLNLDTDRGFKTCRFDNLTRERWIDLIQWNLEALREILNYTSKQNIKLLRLSSDIIPFATKPKEGVSLDWQEYFKETFDELKSLINQSGIRISFHPGQYTVLNSPKEDVVKRAIADLHYHVDLLELLGADQTNKMVIHIGGVYGDRNQAIERFIGQAKNLPERIRRHLVIENDERLFSIDEVLYISQKTGLPVVFDNLHYEVLSEDQPLKVAEYIQRAKKPGSQKMVAKRFTIPSKLLVRSWGLIQKRLQLINSRRI